MDPAASVLHYGQEIFEGLKAYRHADGSVWTFRPHANAARFNKSAQRLALPQLDEEVFVESLRKLVATDINLVPTGDGEALYLRPFMIATEAFLGVRAAREVSYRVIASPAGNYFGGELKPVAIWVSKNYARAGRGGTGSAKCGGNYAASLVAQLEAEENGCGTKALERSGNRGSVLAVPESRAASQRRTGIGQSFHAAGCSGFVRTGDRRGRQ